mgnify:CR=1 FL=1
MIVDFHITNFFKDELKKDQEVELNIGLQTLPVIVKKISKSGHELTSVKPGEAVEVEFESKIPFAYQHNQTCIVINSQAHWRSIKVVGNGIIKQGYD